jgi:hypothetical protein
MNSNLIKALVASATLIAGAVSAQAAGFTNGGFEDGTFNGWTRGSGRWTGGAINTSDYFVGGSKYNASYDASEIVTPGADPIVGAALNRVYNGNFAVRVNNANNNYSVSAVRQTVVNYTDSQINFEWAAVLEESHNAYDSDNFTLTLKNDTKGTTLYSAQFNSATNGPIFTKTGNWYWTKWQVQTLNIAAADIGDTFTLELLASDCPYGGHAGYVYLDGFSNTVVINTTAVPEPSTYGLIGAGALVGMIALRRRFAKKA